MTPEGDWVSLTAAAALASTSEATVIAWTKAGRVSHRLMTLPPGATGTVPTLHIGRASLLRFVATQS